MYQAKLDGRDRMRVASPHTPLIQLSSPAISLLTTSSDEQAARTAAKSKGQGLISLQALQALYEAIQAHTPTTSTHSARMVCLAEETGRRLEALPEDLFLMRLGALFHNIGKIGISEAILNKAGPLDEEE